MGWQDRHYNRDDAQGPYQGGFGGPPRGFGGGGGLGFGMGPFAWLSATGMLLIANVAIFFLDVMTSGGPDQAGPIKLAGYFSYATAIEHGQVWRFFSFQFLHAGFGHIFFNMLALFMFGPMIERYLGSRRFLAYYLGCGVAGAVMYVLLYLTGILISDAATPMVGASAGIFGILAGAAVIAPDTRVMLMFPPIPMKLRTMAMVLMGISLIVILTNGTNAGGEAAHLGGAVLGYLLIRKASLLNFANLGAGQRARRAPRDMGDFAPDASQAPERSSFAQKVAQYRQQRQKQQQQAMEKEIDRILIKVKEQGLHSLTDAEKQALQHETDRKRQS